MALSDQCDGTAQVDIAGLALASENHLSIDRWHSLIRRWIATDAAAHDSARLAELIERENTAAERIDTSYHSR